MNLRENYDVIILDAGLGGLSLCRQLLLYSPGTKILLLDHRAELPGSRQKLGESLAPVASYYFARVLDLEEHLLREHFLKYNARFHWKTAGRANAALEDYSHSYIGKVPEIATYHVNRNKLEEHLLVLALESADLTFCAPIASLQVELSDSGPHSVSFQVDGTAREVRGEWVIDPTASGQILKKRKASKAEAAVRHGASWCWVEGLVDVESLTDLSPAERLRRRDARKQGLFPLWLATNHFCGEGFWFSVVPLKGMTSLGIVFDSAVHPHEKFSTPEKMIEWICVEFPLFQRDLPKRRIVDSDSLLDLPCDCRQAISASKWAVSGLSGRFSDPLYTPGSDLISFCNTLIADAILEKDPEQLKKKAEVYEALMKALYEAYVPSYCASYAALGDQETFTLKYAWELAVYLSFYVFPFINDWFTDPRFARLFLRKFEMLGPVNQNLQKFLNGYYGWKKTLPPRGQKIAKDFLALTPLKRAESEYYRTGLSIEAAEEELEGQVASLKEFARFIYGYVSSVVVGDNQALLNRAFVAGIQLTGQAFDPEALRRDYARQGAGSETFDWNLDPFVMEEFRSQLVDESAGVSADQE